MPPNNSNSPAKPALTIHPQSQPANSNVMHTFTLVDTPISPKASLFSPMFMVASDNKGNEYQKGTTTYTDAGPVKARPAPAPQPTPPRPQPQFKEPQVPDKPQTFLTIQDLQDVSPLTSFSAPSPSPTSHDPEASLSAGNADFRRPSYASQVTNSSSGSRRQDYENTSMHSTSPTTSHGQQPEEEYRTGTSVATRGSNRINPIVFPQQVCCFMLF